jgi:plastocyanin
MPRALSSMLAAFAFAILAATPAFAANASVAIPSRAASFTPSTVTVGPNDSVTWTWTGPANERNHSPASDLRGAPESWDADPQVTPFSAKPDFDHGAGHTFTKQFVNAKAASYVYHCRVHSDMVGTVIVSGAPAPAFNATPTAPFAGDEVSFDAAASTDPDGTIDKYEWDLDGNGTFETDSGTTPSATHTYATPVASVAVALRVTDNTGNVRQVSHPLSVAKRAPTASFTATPGTVAKNAPVVFDATASTATTGRTITDYAWDLDGNGSFETDTLTTPTASQSYTSAGPVNVKVQVTDSAGDTDSITKAVTVSNAAPIAAFTVSNANPSSGATVTFNAAGSSDPDGTVAKFLWDLDGNGTFETDTGTTPTASRAYSATTTVKLRVVDNDNGTTDVTQTVTVPQPPPPPPPPPPSSSSPPPAQPAPAPVFVAPVAAPPIAAVATAPVVARPAPVPAATATKPTASTKKKATTKKKHKKKKKKAKKKAKKKKK